MSIILKKCKKIYLVIIVFGCIKALSPFCLVNAQPVRENPVYVLVPGAWHGGWSYQKVSSYLRQKGAVVYTPSLSGLGEHKNMLSAGINLNTHIEDIVNLLEMEDLHHVILVGHSYSGAVITGVADRIPERISMLVYLDAIIVENGQSAFSVQGPADRQAILKRSKNSKGLTVECPPASAYGVVDTMDAKWVNARLTPQPLRTFTQKQVLKHPFGNHLPKIYISCTNPMLPVLKNFIQKIKTSRDWTYKTIDSPHDVMIIKPRELSEMLLSLAKGALSSAGDK